MRAGAGHAQVALLAGTAATVSGAGLAVFLAAGGAHDPAPTGQGTASVGAVSQGPSIFEKDPLAPTPTPAALPVERGLPAPAPRSLQEGAEGGSPRSAAAAFHDLGDLRAAVGREADNARDDLVLLGFMEVAKSAKGLQPGLAKGVAPLVCLSDDIGGDLQAVPQIYNPPALTIPASLQSMRGELAGPGDDAIVARLRKAERGLGAGECLRHLAQVRLADPESRARDCHRTLISAFASLAIVDKQLEAFPPTAVREYGRTFAYLAPIAADIHHPDRGPAGNLIGYLRARVHWYRSHPAEARAALARGSQDDRSAEMAARARLRRDEVGKMMRLFNSAWNNKRPVTAAWQRARDAWLALDLSAQAWAQGGPKGRVHEAEGSLYAYEAFLNLMEAWRLLTEIQDERNGDGK